MHRVVTSLILLLACASPLFAQASGSLSGIATDQSGAVLPGVTIELTNLATAQMRSGSSGADGYYAIPRLPPGVYRLEATLPGFRRTVNEGVAIAVDTAARADVQLALGTLQESIVVGAVSPLVEARSATLGQVIGRRQIVDLPLNGRNFTQLGTLLPGVVAPPSALGGASGDATPGGFGAVTSGFSVNGMRNQSNSFLLDGASNNDTFNTGFVLRPPPDAIEEFKILTHSYGAEYGRNAGSVINVVTRGGSNELRGGAWWFNRDDALQARNVFAAANQPKPKLQQNQVGGAAGGPLVRNRLFAFGYFEAHRNTSGTTQNIVVLSDAQRAGDFGSAVILDPLTGAPFPGNRIPADRLDSAAVRLLEEFVPNANSGSNRYVASPDASDHRNQAGVRLDFQMDPRRALLGRYLRSQTENRQPPTTRPIGTVSKATLQDVMVAGTHVFTATAINVMRLSYSRIEAQPSVTSGLSNADYGIDVPQNLPEARGLANIAVAGLFGTNGGLGDVQQPFVNRLNEQLQFTNDFTWVRRSHIIKAGGEVRRERMRIAFVNRPNGDYTFNGAITGNPAADFLLGMPAQFRRTTANALQDGSAWAYAAYLSDELRPHARLTVEAGVRYELSSPFVDRNDALNVFRPGAQSQRFPDAPAGLLYPGDPGVPRGTYETDVNNFAPRLGAAWDVAGDGRASLRAGWGLFYDALAGQGDFFQNGVLAPPFTPLVEVNAPPASLTLRTPLASIAGGAAGFPPGLTFIGWAEDFATPYAHHFNVTWQQQIGSTLSAEIGYVGSRGRNLPIFMEANPGVYAPGQTAPGARLFPAFALVRPTFSVGRSWYDALQASTTLRPTHGVSFMASYTLGHARDHVSGLNIGGEPRPVLPVTIGDAASIEQALELENGDALFDVRHRFVLSATADLPAGFQANAIVQAQSGFPITVIDPTLSIRYLTNRPNQVCDANDDAPQTAEQWFRTECFVRRPRADTGIPAATKRNTVRGPGFTRTDVSLFRTFTLFDGHSLQLRAEAFNVLNQVQFRQPGNQIGTATYGRITQAEDGRVIQLAIKYNF